MAGRTASPPGADAPRFWPNVRCERQADQPLPTLATPADSVRRLMGRKVAMVEVRAKRRLAAIVAADVVGYARLVSIDE